MTNMSIQLLWLTHFIEIILVLEFQLTKFIFGAFSYKAILDPKFPLMGRFLLYLQLSIKMLVYEKGILKMHLE